MSRLDFGDGLAYSEICSQAIKITDKEEAKQFLEGFAKYIRTAHHIDTFPSNLNLYLAEAKDALGYYAGHYDKETYDRVLDTFDIVHPVFGKKYPSPGEAYSMGKNRNPVW